jgi:methyl-accepting chemotaxis protein
LALGLLSGYLAARSASRRVDHFANTIRDIMEGDLSRRLTTGLTGDEFDRLAAELNIMLERLQVLMENLRQVTNDIAHDLRSPLARLREHLELSHRQFTESRLTEIFDEALAQDLPLRDDDNPLEGIEILGLEWLIIIPAAHAVKGGIRALPALR